MQRLVYPLAILLIFAGVLDALAAPRRKVRIGPENSAGIVEVNRTLACLFRTPNKPIPGRVSGRFFLQLRRMKANGRVSRNYVRALRLCKKSDPRAAPKPTARPEEPEPPSPTPRSPPAALAASFDVRMDSPTELIIAAAEGPYNAVQFQVIQTVIHGSLSFISLEGTHRARYRYEPSAGFIGEDSFQFAVAHGQLASSPATVHLRVVPTCALSRLKEHGFFEGLMRGIGAGDDARRLLISGDGFADRPTPEPAAQGDEADPGYDARAIARWDTVPFQTVSGRLFAGVVAFHMSGINRVEFSLNGGPWVAVQEASLNPQSCVVEYWAVVKHPLPPGPSEVRAIIYPDHGMPRVLQGPVTEQYLDGSGIQRVRLRDEASLFLFSEAGQSRIRHVSTHGDDVLGNGSREKPFATVEQAVRSVRYAEGSGSDKVAGATIYLSRGVHSFNFPGFQAEQSSLGSELRRYITLRSEPGSDPEEVVIGQGYRGVYSASLHLKDLRVDLSYCRGQSSCNPLVGKGGVLWLENVRVRGLGMEVPHIVNNDWKAAYFTEVEMNDTQTGIRDVALARNVSVMNSGEDSFKFADVIINAKVRNVTNAVAGYHPDVWQYFGPIETMGNLIVYGLDAQQVVAQGIGAPACDGCAFVNVYINNQQVNPESVLQNLQFGGLHRHTYLKNCCLIGRNNFRNDQGFIAQDVVAENSFFRDAAGRENGIHPDVMYRDMASSCEAAVGAYVPDLGPPAEQAESPRLDPPPGTYQGPVMLSLSSATPGAEIRYTLDGTNPGLGSALYTESLLLTANTRIKARAVKYGLLNSGIVEAYFTIQ